MTLRMLPFACAFLLLGVAALAAVPVASARECSEMVDTNCSHATADGLCLLYVGGPRGACILYGPSATPECDQEVEFGCSHWSADGPCAVFVGGADGRCIVY